MTASLVIRRAAAALLVVALGLAALPGCGNSSPPDQKKDDNNKKDDAKPGHEPGPDTRHERPTDHGHQAGVGFPAAQDRKD